MSNNQQNVSPNFSLEDTRNGQKTIKVNGIYLHSKYDPLKEAVSFANANTVEEENISGFLILGLGLGYHVRELATRTDRPIYVLEANKNMLNFANDVCHISDLPNVHILSDIDVEELFFNGEFVEFLSEKPKTIVHPSSFKADSKFYQEFLSFRSDNVLTLEAAGLIDDDIINTGIDENETIAEYSNKLLNKNQLSNSEQLVLATYALFK